MLSDDGFATKRHSVRSHRQKLSIVRAYYPGILVLIFTTSNFVTKCLLKVQICKMISGYHWFQINMGWKMVCYCLDKTEQTEKMLLISAQNQMLIKISPFFRAMYRNKNYMIICPDSAMKENLFSCKRSSSIHASYLICFVRQCSLSNCSCILSFFLNL